MMNDYDPILDTVTTAAKNIIIPAFGYTQGNQKSDGSVVTEIDIRMQQTLQHQLHQLNPTIGFLSEEMEDREQMRLVQNKDQALWILDPLDGTTNFTAGIPFFSVSLALRMNGRIEFGMVYDPMRDESFYAFADKGAYLNGVLIQNTLVPSELENCVAVVDLKRIPMSVGNRILTDPPFRSQRSFGSVALDWSWLAIGRGQVYVHGNQKCWDYAAGQLILHQAGGASSTLDGDPVYNANLQPRSAVAATTKRLHTLWSDWLIGGDKIDQSGTVKL